LIKIIFEKEQIKIVKTSHLGYQETIKINGGEFLKGITECIHKREIIPEFLRLVISLLIIINFFAL